MHTDFHKCANMLASLGPSCPAGGAGALLSQQCRSDKTDEEEAAVYMEPRIAARSFGTWESRWCASG